MKAAVCYEFGKPLVVEEVDLDPPQKSEVKVRLAATAICHSDIHVIRGESFSGVPCVAGHESAGYVEEVGAHVTSVKPGDTVIISMVTSCGKCLYCRTGRPHMCEATWPIVQNGRLHNKKGQALGHVFKTATFAEYAIVDESQTAIIPEDMPMDRAALLACGVITGFGAVVNRARVRPLESVVILGAGGVGLNSVQGAVISGANPVIAIDVSDSKLEAARFFGATHTINATKDDSIQAVKKLTSGRGADYVFVTVGRTAAIEQGFEMSGPRGTTVIIGLPEINKKVVLPPYAFLKPEKVLMGSFMGTADPNVDVPRLVELYRAGKLKLDELITARYPLEKINEAIESVERGEALRNIIIF